MRVFFLGDQRVVDAVVSDGFEAAFRAHDARDGVPLTAEGRDHAAVAASPAILLDVPEQELRSFELARGEARAPRSFAVPPEVLDRHPVLAYRRAPAAARPGAPARRGPRLRRLAAALAALLAALAAGAYALSGVGDDRQDAAGEREAGPQRATGGDASERAARPRRGDRRARRRPSRALGVPTDGRLVGGVAFPSEGEHFFTWDATRDVSPSPRWRRYGTAGVVRTVLRVVRAYRAANPRAPRVGIADLSRPRGGDFGRRYGGRGHLSHQNGLDVDVLYPRRDGRERAPRSPKAVDRRLAQDLVDRFVRAGARYVFVAPELGLEGPPSVVLAMRRHDDHMHVRFPPP